MKQQLLIKLLLLFWSFLVAEASSTPCELRAYQTGLVCVCNETFCDTLEFNLPSDDVLIISSSKSGLRFRESRAKFNSKRFKVEDGEFDSKQTKLNKKPEVNDISQQFFHIFNLRNEVSINHDETHQKIFGFGNAFTGTVSHILKSAPKLKENIYNSYFSKETGNAFNIIRMSIGGSDFDLEPWAYNELPENDPTLSNFTKLDFRDVEKVSQIKELMIVTGNSDIKFVGAAWSSPKWMKTNKAWTGFGQLKEEYYQAWADYHVKYLELMHQSGIDFWAISTGNEPLNGVIGFLIIKFMSLGWLPRAQGKWVSENLGPALRKSSITSKVKLLAGDDQRYTFPWWFEQMYQSYPDSKNFVDGHAVHWYWDKYASPNLLERTRNQFPDKLILATEACSGDKPWEEQRPMLGYWPRCEDYTIDIIEDLNHHVNAWIDWNLLLDADGGPNYANNFVDSPIVVNTTSGDEFYKQPTFYAMGHFSRFFIPDSMRLSTKSSSRSIFATSFLRPDGFTAAVLYNNANHALDVDVKDSSRGILKLTIPAKSIHSLLYK